jgi:uncharacterized OB-fold protein
MPMAVCFQPMSHYSSKLVSLDAMKAISIPRCAKPFVEGLNDGLIRYQMCSRCCTVQNLARYRCLACGAKELGWKDSVGLGIVEAATEIRRASDPAFQAMIPYAILLVRMQEGFSLMAIEDSEAINPKQVMQIGDCVRLRARRWGDHMGLVAFRASP